MPKEKTQKEKLEEAARELESDDSEEAFARVVKKIAKMPLPKNRKPAKKRPYVARAPRFP